MASDDERFLVAMNILAAAYRVPMDEASLGAYQWGLEGLAIEDIERAVKRSIQQGGDFMPSPGALRIAAGAPTRPYHKEWKEPPRMINGEPWPDKP